MSEFISGIHINQGDRSAPKGHKYLRDLAVFFGVDFI